MDDKPDRRHAIRDFGAGLVGLVTGGAIAGLDGRRAKNDLEELEKRIRVACETVAKLCNYGVETRMEAMIATGSYRSLPKTSDFPELEEEIKSKHPILTMTCKPGYYACHKYRIPIPDKDVIIHLSAEAGLLGRDGTSLGNYSVYKFNHQTQNWEGTGKSSGPNIVMAGFSRMGIEQKKHIRNEEALILVAATRPCDEGHPFGVVLTREIYFIDG